MSLRSYLSHLNRRDTRVLPKFSTLIVVAFISLTALTLFNFVQHSFAIDNILKTYQDNNKAGNNLDYIISEMNKGKISNTANTLMGEFKFNSDGSFSLSNWMPGGIIGASNKYIGQLYTPPASGIEYIASLKDEFLGIQPAYAQGVGYVGLQPLLPIWQGMRNAVYVISSFFFIILGFMIMLRVKISPQATVTIQNAIPQLVTTLILVTFSYAIAGLLIDASYVLQGMAMTIIFPAAAPGSLSNWALTILGKVPLIGSFVPSFENLVSPTIQTTLGALIVPSIATFALGSVAGAAIGATIGAIGGPAGSIVLGLGFGSLAAIVIIIIIAIAIIFWLFKFALGLFKCYATLLFKIIIGPLEIGMGAFPNSKLNFSSWAMDVIANLAVFPISFCLIVLANQIIFSMMNNAPLTMVQIFNMLTNGLGNFTGIANAGIWLPSLLTGTATIPGSVIATGAIGLSTLMLLSKLPDMIPQYVFMLKPSPWGNAIGEGLGEIGSFPGRGFSAAEQATKIRSKWYEGTANRNRLKPNSRPDSIPVPGQPTQPESRGQSNTGSPDVNE